MTMIHDGQYSGTHPRALQCASFTCAIVVAFSWIGSVSAEDAPSDKRPATSQKAAGAPLSQRQEVIRDRIGRLEDRMFQLSQALRKSEPDKAERLLEGLSRLRGEQIREQMAKIVEQLNENQLSDANDAQQAVMSDLQSLLKQLMDDPDQIGERKSEIERLEAVRKALEEIVQEQERELQEAEAARAAQRRAEALEAAAQKVKDLVKRQRDAANRTEQSSDLSAEASAQAEIRGATESVAKDVQAVADADEGESSEGAAAEASNALKGASEKMESAEQSLRGDEREPAKQQQEAAAAELENALRNSKRRRRTFARSWNWTSRRRHKRTAEKTKNLIEGMKGSQGESGSKGGEGKESEEGGESEESKQMPGSQNVQDAVPYQKMLLKN
ncbi:MAG: hypothetical protein IPK83_12240 [Planctomycetes bacterium]|nr:hypothetical protein [Planctomycetota bacterium]